MLINLTDVLMSEGKKVEMQVEPVLTELCCRMGTYPVTARTPLFLTLMNLGNNKASVHGKIELSLFMNCDRCLKQTERTLKLEFTREVTGPEEYREEDSEDDQNFMQGYQLDTEALIQDECFLNLPVKVLCSPDCKGICMRCGADLNVDACGCDTFVPDPRMARIKDIFDASKEV